RNIILTLLIIFSNLFNIMGVLFINPVYAETIGREIVSLPSANELPVDSAGNRTIFTNIGFTSNGEEIDEKNPIRIGDNFQATYDFVIPDSLGKEMQDGDFFRFKLPQELALLGEQSGDLKDPGTNIVYGKYYSDSMGNVTMNFNSEVQKHDNVEGKLIFSVSLSENKVLTPGKNIIQVPWSKTIEGIPIYVKSGIDSFIQKEYLNTRYKDDGSVIIDWKVLINPNRNLIQQPKLTEETINESGEKVAKNYQITRLAKANVDFHGNVTETEDVTGLINFDPSGNAYFPSSIVDPYVMYISTPIDYNGQGSIINKAKLSGSNWQEEEARASTTLNESMNIDKKEGVFDESTGEINWEVTFNPHGRHIPAEHASFIDEYDDFQAFIPSSLSVTPDMQYEISQQERGFKFQFKKDVTQPVVIKYKTKVIHREGDDLHLYNTVYHRGGHKTAEVFVPGLKDGHKHSEYSKDYYWDHQSNELDWIIEVNKNRTQINQWNVSDELSSGYILDNSISLKDTTEDKQLIEGIDYSIELNRSEGKIKGFKINYLSEKLTDHQFTIMYKTHFESNVEQANRMWYRYLQQGKWGQGTATKKFFSQKNKISADKYGKYHPDTGEIEWFVTINRNRYRLNKESVLEDSVPEDQVYVNGSAKVLEQNFDNTPFHPTDKGKTNYDSGNNKVKANFQEGTEAAFQLVFRTKLKNKEDIIRKKIKNIAYYQDELTPKTPVEGMVEVNNNQEALATKKGVVSDNDPNIIHWNISINERRFHLKNVAIDDDSWGNNRAKINTIKLVYTSGENKGKQLILGKDYTLDYTERSFHIKLIKDLTESIELTYDADIIYSKNHVPGKEITISNAVRISGSDMIVDDRPVTHLIKTIVPNSMGIIRGTTEQLHVFKVEKGTQNPLTGAVFTLYRGEKIDKEKVVERIVTNGDYGTAIFSDLTKGKYLLVEEKAPDGYVISPELSKGVIIEVTGNKENNIQTYLAENYKQKENKETTEISGKKVWNDYNNKFKTRPTNITVRLYQNDKEYATKEIQADKSGDWTYAFTNLPKYNEQGEAYKYTVKEDPVKGYESKVEGTTITNTYVNKETTEISGKKVWNENPTYRKFLPKMGSTQKIILFWIGLSFIIFSISIVFLNKYNKKK
ncbi:Cna B-type domain-containing protein, partial [Enterococcus faecalis]|nr:Cna B-type domain-containing protein [Enterococcus faecalis]EMC0779783.1 Cna B-type domain-containing protein [Enterococcus faecalis]